MTFTYCFSLSLLARRKLFGGLLLQALDISTQKMGHFYHHTATSSLQTKKKQQHASTMTTTTVQNSSPMLRKTISPVLAGIISLTLLGLMQIFSRAILQILFGCGLAAVCSSRPAIAQSAWKGMVRWRRRCEYQMIIWLLNPNALALFIFWPGWIVVGGGVWVWAMW